jgi:hypothetical protein
MSKIRCMRSSRAAILGLVVVASFSAEGGQPVKPEPRCSIVANDDSVFRCPYLCEGVIYGILII